MKRLLDEIKILFANKRDISNFYSGSQNILGILLLGTDKDSFLSCLLFQDFNSLLSESADGKVAFRAGVTEIDDFQLIVSSL